jgi:hypothetical protein
MRWYENRLNFQVSPTRTIQVKAVIAATYAVGGTTYYLPVCPAVTNLADVLSMDIVLGQGEQEFQFPALKSLPHPGGTQVYNLETGEIYALRYFPRLDYQPGGSTEGYGFVNTGGQSIQTSFLAYGDNGQIVGSSADLHWPAGGQGAYQAEGLLGLGQSTQGWVEARVSRGEMLGFFLTQWFPGGVLSGMDGASVFSGTMSTGLIPRIQMTDGYSTEVRIVNPGYNPISVALQWDDTSGGAYCGSVPVPARGMTIPDLSICGQFDGALYLESSGQFIVSATIRHGDDCLATANAIPWGEMAETLYASHIVLFPGVYFTTIQLYNPAATAAEAVLQPYNAHGTPMAAPVNVTIPSSASVPLTDTQLGLPSGLNSEGWLTITSPGKLLMDCITFGDPAGRQYESTLPLQRAGADDIYFAQVATGDVGGVIYGTGLAIVNPSETTPVQVTVSVHNSDGTRNGNEVVRTLAPREKYVRQLAGIEGIGVLENQASGYIHVSADGPVLSFELFYDAGLNFLSAVQAQSR